MIDPAEIEVQAVRILREFPEHPAARRFCFAGWVIEDYQQLLARLGEAGIALLRAVLPDGSILVGPPAPCYELRLR
jgi:hypothetical protein